MENKKIIELKKIIFDIFSDAYNKKQVTVFDNIKSYNLKYKSILFIEEKIKKEIKNNNSENVFNMFSLLINVFEDLNFIKIYHDVLSNNKHKSYAGNNFELKDMLFLHHKMKDFINYNFENISSEKMEYFTTCYLRLIFNKNNINLNKEEKKYWKLFYEKKIF